MMLWAFNFFLFIETSYFFLGGNGLFCTFVQLYQMLHNSGLHLPQRSTRFIGFTCNVSLHMRSGGKLFSLWCQQVESLESTSQLPPRNQNYRLFTDCWFSLISYNNDESPWSPTTTLKTATQLPTGHSPSSTSMMISTSTNWFFWVFV